LVLLGGDKHFLNVKSIWVYYLLSGGADILTGYMLLWLSHTDVCSARDEQSGVAVEWLIVRLSLSHTGVCSALCRAVWSDG
jgi:hypothetical protein